MNVDPSKAAAKVEHAGKTYYFCAPGCAKRFQQTPGKYLGHSEKGGAPGLVSLQTRAQSSQADIAVAPAPHSAGHSTHHHPASRTHGKAGAMEASITPPPPAAGSADARYTCPMHPEIVQIGPGSCPICGMALEPMDVSAEVEADPEYDSMRRRFWVSAALSLPVLLLSMFGESLRLPLAPVIRNWIELALATPVVLWGGWPFFERFWASLTNRSPNMFTLIGLGTGAAYLDSVVATVFPQLLPASLRDMHGAAPVYFEAAAVITTLVLLGQVLELRARQSTSGAIRALLHLAPQQAHLVYVEGNERDVPLEQVQHGDHLRVKPGERVPVDGTIREGASAVDESMVSGEAMPVEKTAGDKVIGGTLNASGSFVMEAERVGSETVLAQIVKLVSAAQRSRAPMQRLADKVASYFVPAVIAAAMLAFLGWFFFGPEPRFAHALVAGVAVLIIACPCALGLATPMSIMVAVGRGAQAGVLIRSAEALETLAKVDTLVVDKTGTLTEGKPRVANVAVLDGSGLSQEGLLWLAASAERPSEHPLARAIVRAATGQDGVVISGRLAMNENVQLADVTEFHATPGGGVEGKVLGDDVLIGTMQFLEQHGVHSGAGSPGQNLALNIGLERAGSATLVFVAVNHKLVGVLALADQLKESTPQAIRGLREQGLRIVMLTGDRRESAAMIAKELNLDEVRSETTPRQKAEIVKELRSQGRVVAMAGDGINDAPALAAADVGIAMGTGTDVAIESAGITLIKGDLRGIVRARRLSRATIRNIRQNLAFAFLYNTLGIPIAAGVFYPLFGWLLSPMLASAAMSFSSVSVIANALRLRKSPL
jgi:Cu+-exporting ATPase